MNKYENFWINLQEIFSINFKQLAFALVVAIPIGVLIFLMQSRMVIYQVYVLGGKAVITKFCDEYKPGQHYPLVNPGNFDYISKSINDRNQHASNRNYKAKLQYDASLNQYTLNFSGLNDDYSYFKVEGNKIIEAIKEFEDDSYNNLYKNIILNCNGTDLHLFQRIEAIELPVEMATKKKYKNTHIFLNSISPLLIIYFCIIIIRRIRIITKK